MTNPESNQPNIQARPEHHTPARKVYPEAQLSEIYSSELLGPERAARQVDWAEIEALQARAEASPRKRAVITMTSPFDEIQKFYNGIAPGSYVRPHMHRDEWEYFEVVKGNLKVILLSPSGELQEVIELGQDAVGVDIPPGQMHTVFCDEFATVLEIKAGPYLQPIGRDSRDIAQGGVEVSNEALASGENLYIEAKPKFFLASAPDESYPDAGLQYLETLLQEN